MKPSSPKPPRAIAVIVLAVFTAALLVLALGGARLYRAEVARLKAQHYAMLSAVGSLKVSQIEMWRAECEKDVWRIANGGYLKSILERLDKDGAQDELEDHLRLQGSPSQRVFLIDPDKLLPISSSGISPGGGDVPEPPLSQAADGALGFRRPALSEVYRSSGGEIFIDAVAPIYGDYGKPLALLVLRNRAEKMLYPLIGSWPVPSKTAETVLTKRDGDRVVAVNNLRHSPGSALRYSIPMDRKELPAVQGHLGRSGLMEAIDYRGIDVLAYVAPIKDSAWVMVAKIDRAEVLGALSRRIAGIGLLVGLLLLLAGALVALFFARRQAAIARNLCEAQERQHVAEQSYRQLFDGMLDGFAVHEMICGPDGKPADYRFLSVNPAFERMTGLLASSVVGKTVREVLPGTEPFWIETYGEIVRSGNPALFEHYSAELDKFFEVSAFRNAPGQFAALVADVTDRKRAGEELAQSRSMLAQVLDAMPLAIFWKDRAGVFMGCNKTFADIIGFDSPEQIVGKTDYELPCIREDADAYRSDDNEVIAEKRPKLHIAKPYHPTSGDVVWHDTCKVPLFDAAGEISGILGTFQNITERKILERNLLEALDRAESASHAKSEFLAVMSHELRTPLNGVLGFAELLSDTQLSDEQADFVRTIRLSGTHLLQVVNDILDFSSIERNGVRLESRSFSISQLLESVCVLVRKSAEDKGLTFRSELAPDLPESVRGDPFRIRQILVNLLGNAVKFTESGSVEIRATRVQEKDRAFVRFEVADTGPGIDAALIPSLFTPFTQADSSLHRRFEGTGLGLAISERLARAMGGGIDIESIAGKGSKFVFRFPLDIARAEGPERPISHPRVPPVPPPTFAEGSRVLIAEDDRVSGRLLQKYIESFGMESDLVLDGEKAVELFREGGYDAVLMDMQMPRMDGIEATRKLREINRPVGRRVPIIALTANVLPGDRARCIEAGMDEFLSKPIKREDLAEKLSSFLGPREASVSGPTPDTRQ